MLKRFCLLLMILSVVLPLAAKKKDERLQEVTTIFVQGNNQAAEKIRDLLLDGKTCFTLANKEDEADAVLDVAVDADSDSDPMGMFGRRQWIVSGTLTLSSGDLVWSKSKRFGDAPFQSGGKAGGDLLLHQLAKDADCKARKKKDE